MSSSLTLLNGLTVSMSQRFSFNAALRPFISLSSVNALMISSMDIALGTAFTARKRTYSVILSCPEALDLVGCLDMLSAGFDDAPDL